MTFSVVEILNKCNKLNLGILYHCRHRVRCMMKIIFYFRFLFIAFVIQNISDLIQHVVSYIFCVSQSHRILTNTTLRKYCSNNYGFNNASAKCHFQ